MIVVDASALLEVLLQTPSAPAVSDRLFRRGESLAAPHLIDVEVAQVLRRYQLAGELDDQRGRQALEDFADMLISRFSHTELLPRIWELRHNVTVYDAAYLALAEVIGVPLVTRDARLAGSVGHDVTIEVL